MRRPILSVLLLVAVTSLLVSCKGPQATPTLAVTPTPTATLTPTQTPTPFPQVGDHWHAVYTVSVCGETLPIFPLSEGGVHTHGDGLIHIHPTHAAEAGANAHLARFMAGTGGTLTDTSLKLPLGKQYTNGDLCSDGQAGRVFLRVNGIPTTAMATYVPRDGDVLELGFEPQ